MTEPFIDLSSHVTLNLEDDGLRVGLIPHNGGVGVLLSLHTDLGRFVIGMSPNHLQVLYAVIKNLTSFTPEEYQAAYDRLLNLAKQEEQ